ncbi:hypothetical protein J3U66_01480 [Gilliamella sp. B2969]|uniref:hypothetical protein n=1 Tax=unclassified Gilliamella TaxID=2685620 RepID=UPI002269CF38|nr:MULTISPECIES: hypothetical protein [unclassified Gilliamella]MCX8712040.1 hypothetical protein [Gilliamella sp. B3468]MCX8727402.1 hypothetical protein [Gilliamella sp. B2838]MCX8729048.1 hypothetical protein [Gilliamella sp. B2969]MCX8751415.1 hypothetical protein [Gilliamella sp. B3464]
MEKIKYILVFFCSIALAGCFEKNTLDRLIDNPTASDIKLIIDGTELTIPAKSEVNYSFEYGKHTMTYNNDSINFIIKPAKFGGTTIINPTQSNYILHTNVYVTSAMKESESDKVIEKQINNIPIIINGEVTEIPLTAKLINDVFIDQQDYDWDYGLDQDLPEEITREMSKNYAYSETLTKLYRESEYIKLLKQDDIEEEISFPYQPKKFSEISSTHFFPTVDLNAIECEPGREYIKNLYDQWQHLFTLKGGDFVSKYNKLMDDSDFDKQKQLENICNNQIDPNRTYHTAMTDYNYNILRDARDFNFFLIKQ